MKRNKLHIKATLANPETWFSKVSERVPGKLKGNKFYLDSSIGSGFISNDMMQDGLSCISVDVWLNVDFIYERVFKPGEEYYLIIIGLSSGPILSYGEKKEFIFDIGDQYKAIIISPQTSSTLYVNSKESLRMLNILVNKKWIEENVMDLENQIYIRAVLDSKAPLSLEEAFDAEHMEMIKSLFNFRYKNKIQRLSAVVNILSFLVHNISTRIIGKRKEVKKSSEMLAMQNSCLTLQENWKSFPSISVLAKEANMGESSFKVKFKKVVGQSPYQFFLKVKLEKAKEMLLSSGKSVSEVGYECGYSNLSHFSRQFKKEFGVLPKEIMKVN